MKKHEIVISSVQFDPAIEAAIGKTDRELKELAVKNAKHFARRNLPAPGGDHLPNYTGELKTGYEKLAADVFQRLQPAAHFPEAKIDHDLFREKDKELSDKIGTLKEQNHTDEYEMGDFNPGTIYQRIQWAVVATLITMVGEVLFNTKAFQVTGENLLFALILSISISFAVFIFSHMVPLLYKAARTKLQRRLILGGSLLVVIGLFTALAIFRSSYLASHDVHISPVYFVIINLFFFMVSGLLSYFVLPNWSEIKQNASKIKLYRAIARRHKAIKQIGQQRDDYKQALSDRTRQRIRLVHTANYSADIFRKMYRESVEVFKRTNLAYRTDGYAPDCFAEPVDEADINDVSLNVVSQNRKA